MLERRAEASESRVARTTRRDLPNKPTGREETKSPSADSDNRLEVNKRATNKGSNYGFYAKKTKRNAAFYI